MVSTSSLDRLQSLRSGDRFSYYNLNYNVKDYSSYTDEKGYQTEEWLLNSSTGFEYYLLREVDPDNPSNFVNWYLSEEVAEPNLFNAENQDNIITYLWKDMQEENTPYAELKIYGDSYYFESKTEGTYQGEYGESNRITWDYWDRTHQRNLAIEAWPDGELHVYLTKLIKPEQITIIEKSLIKKSSNPFPIFQVIFSVGLIIWGLLLLRG
ncbi:MAG TPA: DUF4178 domain-containing protein [Halomicronema sp.]